MQTTFSRVARAMSACLVAAVVIAAVPAAHAVTASGVVTNEVAQIGPAFAAPGATNVPLLSFTLTGVAPKDHFRYFTAKWAGNSAVPNPDVERIRVYREKGPIVGSSFNAGSDSLLRTLSGGSSSNIRLDVPDFNFVQTKLYLVVDVKATAVPGRTLDMKIEADKIVLKSGTWPPATEVAVGRWHPAGHTVINSTPVASPRSLSTPEDTALAVTLTGSDDDGNQTSLAVVSNPTHGIVGVPGSVSCSGSTPKVCNSSIVYTPSTNFNGHDSFTYRAIDSVGAQSEPAIVNISVGPGINDFPVANADNATTAEETLLGIDPRSNDTDPDGDPITIASADAFSAHNGSVVCSTTACAYTPAVDFNGLDTFSYTISDGQGGTASATATVTVTAVNDAPIAIDDTYSVDENTTLVINDSSDAAGVLDNDADVDGLELSAALVSDVSDGTLALASDGTFTYTPDANFVGIDTFTYRANDTLVDSGIGTASIYVGDVNHPPVADNDAMVVPFGATTVIDVLANDSALPDTGETLTVSAVSQGASGTVTIASDGSSVSYTPNAGFTGNDTFGYTVSDGNGATDAGIVDVSVAPAATVSGPPTLTGSISITFTEPVRLVGPANVTVTVKDSTATLGATLACKNGSNAATCSTGPVTSATLRRTWTAGQKYSVKFNPTGVQAIEDISGNAMPQQTGQVRASRVEQETSIGARAAWRNLRTSAAYGGSYRSDRLAGASATYTFTGTGISWYTVTGRSQGMANVYIDSKLKKKVNNFSTSTRFRVRRAFGSLANRKHTIRIVVLGRKGSTAGTGANIAVDAFKVGTTLSKTPVATWRWQRKLASLASGGAYMRSDRAGSTMSFRFRGDVLRWCTVRGPGQGKAKVYVGNSLKGTFDNYRSTAQYGYCRTFTGLGDSLHTVKIVVLGAKRASSRGTSVVVDRWLIDP